MGPLFVLILWCVVAGVLVLPCAAIGAGLAGHIARRAAPKTRRRFRIFGAVLPAAVAVYLLSWAVALGVYGEVTGRDLGFGDSFGLPLQDGYRFQAIDTLDSANILNANGETVLADTVQLQEQGEWLMAASRHQAEALPSADGPVRPEHWALLNTRTHHLDEAASAASLQQLAAGHGLALHLQSASAFYGARRYTWADGTVALALLLPGLVVLVALLRHARRVLRRDRLPA